MKINRQSIAVFLLQELEKQRRSLFLWAPVFMGMGILTYFQMDRDIPWFILVPALVFALLAIGKSYFGYLKTGQNRWLATLLIAMIVGLFTAGYGVMQLRHDMIDTPTIEKDMRPTMIEGTIERLVRLEGGKAKRVILRDVILDPSQYNDDILYRVRLKTYHFKGDDWHVGDRVSLKAKLMKPSQPVMPGGFDFSRKAYFDRLSAVGFTMADATLLKRKNGSNDHFLERIRSVIGSHVYAVMDPQYAGIAQALLTGERSGIARDDTDALRASGLAHLLAISGLHIGLVAGCVFYFVRLFLVCIPSLALRYPIKKWAAVAAIIIAFSYMILAGATVPTVRAFIMTSLVLLAVILDRSAMNMRLVAFAALFVMMTTPEAVMGPSFALSFAAVAALITFYRDFGRKWLVSANAYKPIYRPFYYIVGIALTSVVATLSTAPFSVMYHNRFALYGVISNIAAMPLMAFIVMPFGLLAALLIPFGLDGHFWVMMQWGIHYIVDVAHAVEGLKYASLPFPSFDTHETILILFGFVFFLLWRGVLRWIGLPLMVVAFIMSATNTPKQIMISEDMNAILIVDKSVANYYLIGKMNGYLKSNWLGFHGVEGVVDVLSYDGVDKIALSNSYCDDFMCRIMVGGVNATILFNAARAKEACKGSDIVIAKMPLKTRYCTNVDVIDWFDVWRHGATTVDFKGNGQYEILRVK